MLFNSLEFLVFFAAVVGLYYLLPHKRRWILLLLGSYYFYMAWNPLYILLIMGSTVVDYFCGLRMSAIEDQQARKPYLYASLLVNLGLLGTFKYFNFFSDSFTTVFQWFDPSYEGITLELLLPMGISFYTFQTMSYSIDIYYGRLKAEKHAGIFALFVTFFPQLVAGPIERAGNLLDQFKREVSFDYDQFVSGMRQAAWGFFKKLVIADRLAPMVNQVYDAPEAYTAFTLALATVYFAFQIYCDFSGYSDIAIGTARMLGFDLMENFQRPYWSKSIGEFWQRWHISLSTRFRDYLYIPLGGNRVVKWRWYYNLFITFLVSGLWHGANWTFVVWGALHGTYLIIENLLGINRRDFLPRWQQIGRIIGVFMLVNIAWIFFRAQTVQDAWFILTHMFTGWNQSMQMLASDPATHLLLGKDTGYFLVSWLAIAGLQFVEWFQRSKGTIYFFEDRPWIFRWSFYVILLLAIGLFGMFHSQAEFIYFQF